MPSRARFGLLWAVLGLMTVVLSLLPGGGDWLGRWTSAGHLPAYAVLTAAGAWARPGLLASRGASLALAAAGALLLGVSMELLQPLFGRQASWLDLGLNMLGVGLGLVLAELGWQRYARVGG
ncbi:hypothetical protein [Alkalilimnicola sp. S0819]|uniref:hypothetical protein n=1 Tax=Alkalilimnicola sp. S0819 TaxID=2613922 RepID=UPI00128D4AE8|nr:hypothetical protein [Alkalilimnicola sp. S0819]KAB7622847.1 hypothetical protein F3N43_11030 [Alkalilimnicola sp. S0819]MPQ17169.1 hypothetical protein [Alkalilimnicola sp. S0819]